MIGDKTWQLLLERTTADRTDDPPLSVDILLAGTTVGDLKLIVKQYFSFELSYLSTQTLPV